MVRISTLIATLQAVVAGKGRVIYETAEDGEVLFKFEIPAEYRRVDGPDSLGFSVTACEARPADETAVVAAFLVRGIRGERLITADEYLKHRLPSVPLVEEVIPSDGLLDGGEPYTEEELKIIRGDTK